MHTAYLDLETLPTDRADVIADLEASIKAPATYKKADSIAEWMEANRASELDTLIRKTAMNGTYGRICCAGWAIDDGHADAAIGDERYVILSLFEALDTIPHNLHLATTVVGHNVMDFDLKFLQQRCIVNGIKMHPVIRTALKARPFDTKVYDTMKQWSGYGKYISLDKLCRALNIPSPKGDMEGSKVWDYWQAGRFEEISRYCRKDVDAVRAVHQRMVAV